MKQSAYNVIVKLGLPKVLNDRILSIQFAVSTTFYLLLITQTRIRCANTRKHQTGLMAVFQVKVSPLISFPIGRHLSKLHIFAPRHNSRSSPVPSSFLLVLNF